VLGFDSGKVISQVNSQQRGYRDQTDNSWYTSQVKGVAEELAIGENDDDDNNTRFAFPSTQLPAANHDNNDSDHAPSISRSHLSYEISRQLYSSQLPNSRCHPMGLTVYWLNLVSILWNANHPIN
jgi:hypothetical protein